MSTGNITDDCTFVSLPLHAERAVVKRRVRKTLVRATRSTVERVIAVDEALAVEQVVIRRVPIGRVVEAIPPIRDENGVTILPVVEEELVLVRRLVLKEEVHLERVRATIRHVETVVLRREEVAVTRSPAAE